MKKQYLFAMLITLAQVCVGQMNPQYDTYTTYALDSSFNVHQTVVVEGSTTGSCYYTCGPNNQQCEFSWCGSATHTAKINNVIGGAGGWYTGAAQNPFSYISSQTTTTAQIPPGQQKQAATEAEIICSYEGLFFQEGGGPLLKITNTYWGPPVVRDGDVCYWSSSGCLPGTTPTCTSGFGISFVSSCPSYVKVDWLVVGGACIVNVPFAASGPGACN